MTFKEKYQAGEIELKPSMTMWMSGTTAMTRERWRNSSVSTRTKRTRGSMTGMKC